MTSSERPTPKSETSAIEEPLVGVRGGAAKRGLIDPVETANRAIKAGLLIPSGGESLLGELVDRTDLFAGCSDYAKASQPVRPIHLPSEVNLSPVLPPPKTDHRKGLRLRPLKPNHRPRYVIHAKDRPDLFPQ